jgi:MYXO-CTERM domain-containing protein
MKIAVAMLAVAGLACAATAQTAVLPITADTPTWDAAGSVNNVVLTFDVASLMGFAPGTPITLQTLSYNVSIETVGESWLSEARLLFRDSASTPLFNFRPSADGRPSVGIENFSGGPLALSPALPPAALFLPDGVLKIEFFESFDDLADEIDAFYRSGSVTFTGIPTPGAAALLGLGGLAAARRRR